MNLRKWIHFRDLLREMVVRDMKLRYKRSALGISWSLLNPLMQLLVFGFVFRLLLPLNIPDYALFLFTGILVWNWLHSSLYSATGAIVDNAALIRQPGFPAAVLPIVSVAANLVNFLLALPVLIVAHLAAGHPLTGAVLALPLLIAVQFTFTLSLAYLLATLHVPYRDTQYMLGVLLMLGFYLAPVFYDSAAIPERYRL
ncbi:MAG: ABC transporter permease, partial [Acidobacteria bacterium]|nr:ABC transporter permease [Acidobacteriota bacterium]